MSRNTLFGYVLLFLSSVFGSAFADTPPPPSLETSAELATAGYYSLRWKSDAEIPEPVYELQSSENQKFSNHSIIYDGPLLGRVISGQSDGTYYYRVRTVLDNGLRSQWSNVVKIETRHHSLERAIWFFAAGAVVFLLTLAVIVLGTLKTRKQR